MKASDVKIGEQYKTKIGLGWARVLVKSVHDRSDGKTIFVVARPSAPDRLMLRSAARLARLPEQRPTGRACAFAGCAALATTQRAQLRVCADHAAEHDELDQPARMDGGALGALLVRLACEGWRITAYVGEARERLLLWSGAKRLRAESRMCQSLIEQAAWLPAQSYLTVEQHPGGEPDFWIGNDGTGWVRAERPRNVVG